MPRMWKIRGFILPVMHPARCILGLCVYAHCSNRYTLLPPGYSGLFISKESGNLATEEYKDRCYSAYVSIESFVESLDDSNDLKGDLKMAMASLSELCGDKYPQVAKERICQSCGRVYPITSFRKHTRERFGRVGVCKKCMKKQEKEGKQKKSKRNRRYKEAHKDEIKAYRNANKERFGEYARMYRKERHKDPIKRLSDQARGTISQSFLRKGYKKDTKSAILTGLSSAELTDYLLQTFELNYGKKWDGVEPVHIDHIVPLKTAKSEEDVKRLCHFSNLQLLTAQDNLRKSASFDYEIKS